MKSLFVLQEVNTDVMCDYVFHFSIYIYHKKPTPYIVILVVKDAFMADGS